MTFRRARASVLLLWLVACGGGGGGPPPDPCAAAGVCTSPPEAYCASSTVAVTFPAAGTCTSPAGAAVCAYPPTEVDCALTGKACGVGGTCVDPCAAAGVCTSPPAAYCASSTVAVTYPAAGTCTSPAGAAVCDYAATQTDCALTGQVCGGGAACVDPVDPCATAPLCDTPPAAYCASSTVAVTYPATGTCSAPGGTAVCAYPPTEVDCALAGKACGAGGTCVDPCATAVCTSPPAAYCASSTVAVTFQATGTCTSPAGAPVCAYPSADEDCALAGKVCGAGGACVTPVDPCAIPADGAGFLLFTDARSGDFEIRAIKVDGTCDQLVGSGQDYDLDPAWSAATGLTAWSAGRGGGASIVVQPAPGGTQRVLDTGAGLAFGPAISPDGALVAFERMVVGGSTADVLVVPVAGGTPTPVAEGTANEAGPVFSFTARGNFVYFVSNRGGPTEVWRVPVSAAGAPTGSLEQVTTGSQLVGKATVSGDGRYVAWCQATGAIGPRIVVRDLETAQERVLSDSIDSEPAYAATGNLMAVKTGRYSLSNGDVVLIDATTGALVKRLTNGNAMVGAPAFPR